MVKKTLTITALTGAFMLGGGFASAADQQDPAMEQAQAPGQASSQSEDRIFGRQLMTAQERTDYRNRMRAAKTAEERDKIRAEHHELMKARAKERGVTLPDEPPPRGGGMGPSGGMKPGGGGMGY